MSLKPFLSFAGGELDPVLHDNVTLEKFNRGLATARNVVISKTGTILSRHARKHLFKSKNNGEKIKLYSPPNSGYLLEFGPLYMRSWGVSLIFGTQTATFIGEVAHSFTEDDLEKMHFVSTKTYVYVFVKGKATVRIKYDDSPPTLVTASTFFTIPAAPTNLVTGSTAVTLYPVDYAITLVKNGEESLPITLETGVRLKPNGTSEYTDIEVTLDANPANIGLYNEIRVYQRPEGGGAYGFLGSSSKIFVGGGAVKAKFRDLGATPDFSNSLQDLITKYGLNGKAVADFKARTGTIYQQRLIMTDEIDEEALFASRPGYQNNFYRDFPYSSDSALQFKAGTTGRAKVLRVIENDGLIVFTSIGVYVSVGLLTVNNLGLEKKGNWIIDDAVPPLAVPGGVFFVDKDTNTVRTLVFSQDIQTYESVEQSIFSNHIFRKKIIKSWCFHEGDIPLIIVTFSDGTFANFTYNYEHQMRAWTRGDSVYPVEQAESSGFANASFIVTNKNGNRYVEILLPRFIPNGEYEVNPEVELTVNNTFMDACISGWTRLQTTPPDVFTVTPQTPGEWADDLLLDCGSSALFPDPGLGEVGTIFKHFDLNTKAGITLEVISRINDNQVIVKPSGEFPSDQASDFRLYLTTTTVSGLSHLEGETVSVVADGFLLGSPKNDKENYTEYTVTGGVLTPNLPEPTAIVIVGRPVVADVKTLNISTVEQAPTLIESLNVNKLFIKIFESLGLYCSNKFPEESLGDVDGSSVADMEDLDESQVPIDEEIVGNRPDQPYTKRIEKMIPGSWENNGQIAIRQVDPFPFQIVSIIPDLEVLSRSNR